MPTSGFKLWFLHSKRECHFLKPEHLGIGAPRQLGTKAPRYLDTWTPGHLDTGTPGHRVTKTTGHRDTSIPGNLDTRTLGHWDTWVTLMALTVPILILWYNKLTYVRIVYDYVEVYDKLYNKCIFNKFACLHYTYLQPHRIKFHFSLILSFVRCRDQWISGIKNFISNQLYRVSLKYGYTLSNFYWIKIEGRTYDTFLGNKEMGVYTI